VQVVLLVMEETGFMAIQELVEKVELVILRMVPLALVLEAEEVLEIHMEHRLNLQHLHLEIHFHQMVE
jgi:hypothetical protein